MSSYYHYTQHQHTAPAAVTAAHPHHSGRSRRAPRLSTATQNAHKQFRGLRAKELPDTAHVAVFRQKFESIRSFDLDDDLEFCPSLLTESDLHSIHSSSDRSSLSSGSPESSPTQQAQTVAPSFSLNSSSNPYIPSAYQAQPPLKMHQPAATRIRNAIPIVNPSTGVSMSSPSPSVSPARLPQSMARRW